MNSRKKRVAWRSCSESNDVYLQKEDATNRIAQLTATNLQEARDVEHKIEELMNLVQKQNEAREFAESVAQRRAKEMKAAEAAKREETAKEEIDDTDEKSMEKSKSKC